MLIKKPEQYHGTSQKRPFFEGWYHKMSSASGESIVAIPGIYRSGITDKETAFLMLYEGSSEKVHYIPYSVDDFYCEPDKYALRLGNNYFSMDEVQLNITTESLQVQGQIIHKNTKPWPVTLLEPGCMGWYSYVPTMECFHGILSMDHELNGHIQINDLVIQFDGGRGYMEKDWGRNFPQNWIWAQSNKFEIPGLSISASLATIPWRGTTFPGFIVGIQVDDQLYRFAPYRRSKIDFIQFNGQRLIWHLTQGETQLKLEVIKGTKSGMLYAPDQDGMLPKVPEYLDASINFQLKQGNNYLAEGISQHAALEIVGDVKQLIN